MGLSIQAILICDKCIEVQQPLESIEAPLPPGWMKDQGYANISEGVSATLLGYYCPICIQAFGTRDLAKHTADMARDLTDKPQPPPPPETPNPENSNPETQPV